MTLMTPSSSSSSSRVKTGTRGAHEEFTRYRKLWSQVTGGVIPRIVLRKSHSGVNIRIMQALYDISIGFLEIGLIWLAWYAIARYEIRIGDSVMIIDGAATIEEVIPSVIREAKPKRSDGHPTMKPVALIERMLRNNARPGDIVLDLFGGSGSTLIAAERLGMCARLSELDPGYCDVIVARYEAYTGRAAVLEARDAC